MLFQVCIGHILSDTLHYLSNKLTSGDGVKMIKDGACHSLIFDSCSKDDSAAYRFEAEGRKSEATLEIKGQEKNTEMF